MKLKKICISNMRGKNITLNPDKINTLFAKNGSGKTTIQDGIRYGLTGLIPKDVSTQPRVEMELESGLSFARDKSCTIGIKKVPVKVLNETIASETGIPIEQIKISSSMDILMAKKPEEFLAILMEYIREGIDINRLKGYISNMDMEIEHIIDTHFPAMPDKFSVDMLDKVADDLYAERKLLNAELSQKKAIYDGVLSLPRPVRERADILKDLDDAKAMEQDAQTLKAKWDAYEAALNRQRALDAEIASFESQINGVNVIPISQEQREQYEKTKERNDKVLIDSTRDLSTAENNIALFKRTLSNLEKPVCPISDRLVCSTDKTAIKNEMMQALKDNELLRDGLQANIQAAKQKQEALRKTRIEFDEVDKKVMEKHFMEEKLGMLRKQVIDIPPKPLDMPAGQDIKALISELNKELKEYDSYKDKSALEKEINLLSTKVKTYADLIASLKDKGEVKAKVIEYYFSIFENVCNDRAREFSPGYEIRFLAKDGVRPLLKTPSNGDFYPLESLSSGEKLIGSFLLMDMLNQLNGTHLMFLDDLEILDKDALINLRRLIEDPNFLDAYDHIFIMGVDHKDVMDAFSGLGTEIVV